MRSKGANREWRNKKREKETIIENLKDIFSGNKDRNWRAKAGKNYQYRSFALIR